jgi:hypothetical protein
MDQISTEALIFMILGWTFVLFLAIFPMVKILSSKISYKEDD